MDARQKMGKEAPAADADHSGISVSRRRFTRAGLSGSVILGSLASKPVLGAVPYHCTVSGQVSGNLSRVAVSQECDIGHDEAYWIGAETWPSGFTKGTLPSKKCEFDGQKRIGSVTMFNGYSSAAGLRLIDAFFSTEIDKKILAKTDTNTQTCAIVKYAPLDGKKPTPASMLQVLSMPTDAGGEEFELGRVVVTSLLNAAYFANRYPVTTHAIIAMFNATFDGGSFEPVTGATWSRSRVIEYLRHLYTPEAH